MFLRRVGEYRPWRKKMNKQQGKLDYPFPKRQMLDSFKLKEFADENFKFDENGRESYKQIEKTVRKGEIAHYEQFLLFPQCFQKTCIKNT